MHSPESDMNANAFAAKADQAWKITMALCFFEMLILLASTTIFAPAHKSPQWLIGVLECLPLLLLLPWLLRRNIRSAILLCFLLLGYFLPVTQQMFMFELYGWMPFLEVSVIITLFISSMLFARWEQKRFGISVTR